MPLRQKLIERVRAQFGRPAGLPGRMAGWVMALRQAARRNAEAVRRGQLELRLGRAENLPALETPFDKILAVNAVQFWDQPVEPLQELRRVLSSGGRIAIAFQPRGPGASDRAATSALRA